VSRTRPGQQLHDSEAVDRAGRGRLLRYCARPPFALDRPREPERLLDESTKPGSGGIGPLLPTPLETARPPRRAGAAAVDPPSSLLRRACASGRSPEIFATAPNGWNWPISDRQV
jgi:hypothetical protein